MTISTGFCIGTSYPPDDLADFDPPIDAPLWSYNQSRDTVILADGSARGFGLPSASWRFGFLTNAQRDELREICPGASANVFIKTKTPESDENFVEFSAVMYWPVTENAQSEVMLDITIEFANLIGVT